MRNTAIIKDVAKLIGRKFILIMLMIASVQLYAHPHVYIKVRPERPAVVVVHPTRPGPRHIWVDGDWVWNPGVNNYVWTEGRWVLPEPYSKWIPGHWKQTYEGYYWVPGHWKRY